MNILKLRWTSIAWSIVYLLLLLSLKSPLIVITSFFMLLPGLVLFTLLPIRSFIVHIIPILVIVALLAGPAYVLLSIYFLIPSMLMGLAYKRRAAAFKAIAIGAGTILVEFLIVLLLSKALFDFNLSELIESTFNMTAAPLEGMSGETVAGSMGLTSDAIEQLSQLTVRLLPFTLSVCALVIAWVGHALARPTLASLGQVVPKLQPLRTWRLPRSLVWYYLVALLLSMFVGSGSGFLNTVLLNMIPMLGFCFMIQTASFFFFLAYERKWNAFIPIVLIIVMLFFQPLRIIGILDILFPLRDKISRSGR
ncbi:DUF2232 domain-containing protein [Paenibacillus yonginensis]|uniref:DUF2232 domain-containing protein n=1 Tax=Paenibacillus yonginensis TaxID=1462996 RepID=UPI001F447A91|nr:DUF2232 domain-containing protein [Paenibacillus yonginensis]